MGDNSTADLRDCVDGLLTDLRRLASSPHPWPYEGLNQVTTRMAAFILAAGAPAANDVARAVAEEPARFGRRIWTGHQTGPAEEQLVERFDRRARIDRRSMAGA